MRYFVAFSASVRRVWVLKLKSVGIVLCCCVQYVEIYIEQWAFAGAINFLFSFEETTAESYRFIREALGEHAPSQDMCERLTRCLKSEIRG